MKKIHFIFIPALMILFSFGGSQLIAQKAEKTNVKKELKQVLKDLSAEDQQQVLKYAKKRAEAAQALEKNKAMVKEQANATPQPKKAEPAKVKGQPIQLDSKKNAGMGASPEKSAIMKPKRPSYIEKASSLTPTTVTWDEEIHKFGKVKTGEVVKHTFKFKNTGDQPLVLTRVKASCGCTTPKWSTEPIPPGKEGFIDVSFNTSGKMGVQNKSVTVTGNFEKFNKILRISGQVTATE